MWNAITSPNDGGSTVTSYNVYWDSGTGTTNVDLTGSATTFTLL